MDQNECIPSGYDTTAKIKGKFLHSTDTCARDWDIVGDENTGFAGAGSYFKLGAVLREEDQLGWLGCDVKNEERDEERRCEAKPRMRRFWGRDAVLVSEAWDFHNQ